MPFKKFKAEHGGQGPFELAYSSATGGQGLFGRLGMRHERQLTDDLIDTIGSNEEFKGFEGMLEAGRSPLTREQHSQFRSGLIQAALDRRVFNAGFDELRGNMANARKLTVGDDDTIMLDNFDALANHAMRLASTGHTDKASELLGTVLQNFGAYAQRNEEQRLELESSDAAQRETMRKEIQGQLYSTIFNPMREDTSNYASIKEQLAGLEGAAVAEPSLVSAVLEYAGASLRQSDDGNWSFAIGPLGLTDTNLPAMTVSQLRNRLESAFKGRDEFMRGEAARFGEEAKKRGFGINGTGVDDLLFPLANAEYRRREAETKPPAATSSENLQRLNDNVTEGLSNVGHTLMPNIVEGLSSGFDWLFGGTTPSNEVMHPGDSRPGNTRRAPGSVSGIIQRPTND